jgi:hypothetical protein
VVLLSPLVVPLPLPPMLLLKLLLKRRRKNLMM